MRSVGKQSMIDRRWGQTRFWLLIGLKLGTIMAAFCSLSCFFWWRRLRPFATLLALDFLFPLWAMETSTIQRVAARANRVSRLPRLLPRPVRIRQSRLPPYMGLKPFRRLPGRPTIRETLTMMYRPILMVVQFPCTAWAGFLCGINLIWFNVLNGTASPVLHIMYTIPYGTLCIFFKALTSIILSTSLCSLSVSQPRALCF